MARDQDAIERDIEQAREALASTLDELTVRAHPKRLVDAGKRTVREKLAQPKVRYALIGVGAAIVVLLIVRRARR